MIIPNGFEDAMASTFYDKTITKIEITRTVSTDGQVMKAESETSDTIKVNERFDNCEIIRQEQGISEQVDVSMTCRSTESISENEVWTDGTRKYRIMKVIQFDSHKLIVGQLWLSDLQTLPSA